MCGMTVAEHRNLAAEFRLVFPVLAQCLQQAIAHAHRAPIGHDHRLVDQRAHEFDDVAIVDGVESADLLR